MRGTICDPQPSIFSRSTGDPFWKTEIFMGAF